RGYLTRRRNLRLHIPLPRFRLQALRRALNLPFLPIYFFFNDPATTEIYTLSLHDALPIWILATSTRLSGRVFRRTRSASPAVTRDRKSTRLNSSHDQISYAVFCLKKKNMPQRIVFIVDRSVGDFRDRAKRFGRRGPEAEKF